MFPFDLPKRFKRGEIREFLFRDGSHIKPDKKHVCNFDHLKVILLPNLAVNATPNTFIQKNTFNLKLNKPSANPSQVLFKSNYSTIHDHIQIQHANIGCTTGNLKMKDLNVCLFGQFAVKGLPKAIYGDFV